MKRSIIAVGMAISATAQNTTGTATSQITIQSTGNYSASSLEGYHVGAALSYMVAASPGPGNSFTYNTSASADQLLDNDIAAGYPLPCYVVVTSEISDNAGPLECGAGVQPGDFDVVAVDGSGMLAFDGVNAWFVCAVQSFTYGWVQGTVVGLYGNGGQQPSGPGVENCTAVDGLRLVSDGTGASTSTTSTSTSTSMTMTMSATSTDSTPTPTPFSIITTTTLLPCPSQSTTMNTTQVAPYTTTPTATSPIAPFTGAANTIRTSGVAGLFCAAVMLLLLL